MGKKQHQKDKLYLTTTEWKYEFGGHKDDLGTKLARAKYKRLPITHCALSLTEFENPVCTKEGIIFDIVHIIPFIKRYGVNPVNGEKLTPKDLIKLNFHKNVQGDFHCPITYKVFNNNSHIVAVRPSGNVYMYEAVEQLNIKPKIWKDLLDDTPFTRSDIITLQDPLNLDRFNIENFHHVKLNLKSSEEIEQERKAMSDPQYTLRRVNNEAREALAQLARDYKPSTSAGSSSSTADEINAAHYSTGRAAASFTSTAMPLETKVEAAVIDEETLRYKRVKKNGYVQLVTNKGPLNLELYATDVPKTCENFILLCKKGYYDNTIFHRLIKNFMVQGGDPTGKGTGGESAWGGTFKDEFVKTLKHVGRGTVSMANAGPNTNKSQLTKHLDNKHTVFGRVVGGLETLTAIEETPTDEKTDRPLEPLKLLTTKVFVDPFMEASEQLQKEREELAEKKAKEAEEEAKTLQQARQRVADAAPKPKKTGVGRYLQQAKSNSARVLDDAVVEEPQKKKTKSLRSELTDFSAW